MTFTVPGERKIVEIDGRSIGVFDVNGEFYAIRNQCAHQGGPLCKGLLTGFLQAKVPGEYTYARKGEVLRCSWHGWEFDVKTGQSWWDPSSTRARSYKVEILPGEKVSGLQKGPYLVETYPVSVEEQYVVIQL